MSGAAIEKFSALSTLEMRVSDLQILADFSQIVSAETDLDLLYEVLHNQSVKIFGPDLEFAVALYDRAEICWNSHIFLSRAI